MSLEDGTGSAAAGRIGDDDAGDGAALVRAGQAADASDTGPLDGLNADDASGGGDGGRVAAGAAFPLGAKSLNAVSSSAGAARRPSGGRQLRRDGCIALPELRRLLSLRCRRAPAPAIVSATY